jgi:hypothetical protein
VVVSWNTTTPVRASFALEIVDGSISNIISR